MKEYFYKIKCSKCGGKLNTTYGLGKRKKNKVFALCEKCNLVSYINSVLSTNYTLYNFAEVKIVNKK